jgi:hypothetical protein
MEPAGVEWQADQGGRPGGMQENMRPIQISPFCAAFFMVKLAGYEFL